MSPHWASMLSRQASKAGVPFYFKQRGSAYPDKSRLLAQFEHFKQFPTSVPTEAVAQLGGSQYGT